MNARLRDPTTRFSFVSRASYWLPELVVESAWLQHAPFAFWLMGALRPRTMVELGVERGFSYFAFCQAVQRLALDARCFAVDHWAGDAHAGFYGEDVYHDVCRHNRRYEGFSHLIRADFSDAHGAFADGSIDLLHIDGCHSYEAVQRDFETWRPKLSRRGVVVLHDIAEYQRDFGVYLLWEALRDRYPHFEFTHGHGLGIVGVGAEIPDRVRALFAASASAAASQAIRMTYQRLGGFVASLRDDMPVPTRQVRRIKAVISSCEASASPLLSAPLRRIVRLMRAAKATAGALGDAMRDATRGAAREADRDLRILPSRSTRPQPRAPSRRTRNTA